MTSPVLDKQKHPRPFEDLIHPTNDERFGIAGDKKEDTQFAVSKSDLMSLIRGETLIYGPLRRVLALEDGPFVIIDEDQPVPLIKPPEPIEFTLTESIPVEEPDLRERITATLRKFVDGVFKLVGRGGEGSGFEGHAGRPGEVGGSQPSDATTFVDRPSSQQAADLMKRVFGSAGDKIEEAAWIAPDGEALAPGEDHQQTAVHVLDRLGMHPDTYRTPLTATVNMVDLGLVRYTRFQDINAFSLPRENLTKAQKDTIVGIMIRIKARDPRADFSFDQAFAGGGRPEFRSLRGRQIAALLKLNTDFWDVSGLSVHSIFRGGPGSGFKGHAGRPGEVGGSVPSGEQVGEDGAEDSEVGKIGEALQKDARHIIALDVLDQVREGRGWLSPDGIFTTNFGSHDSSSQKALKDVGIEYSGGPQSKLIAMGFARLMLRSKEIDLGSSKKLTFPQARFMAFLLDKDSTRSVFVDYYDNDGEYIESVDKGKGRDALGKLVNQGYRLVGKTWVSNSGVARHGEHVGQEGREGAKGGSQPGFTHGEGEGVGTGAEEIKFSEGEQKEADQWAEENFLSDFRFEEKNIAFLEDYKNSVGVYASLNRAFRSESEFIFENRKVLADFRDAIDEAMDKSLVPENMVVYRGISNQTAQRLLASGETFTDLGYVSTSLTPFDAELFAFEKDAPAVLEIFVPKGTKGIYMEPFSTLDDSEEEVLLDRGLTYEFTSKEARVSENVTILGENYRVWEVRVVGKK